jgi:hypothetical protein
MPVLRLPGRLVAARLRLALRPLQRRLLFQEPLLAGHFLVALLRFTRGVFTVQRVGKCTGLFGLISGLLLLLPGARVLQREWLTLRARLVRICRSAAPYWGGLGLRHALRKHAQCGD